MIIRTRRRGGTKGIVGLQNEEHLCRENEYTCCLRPQRRHHFQAALFQVEVRTERIIRRLCWVSYLPHTNKLVGIPPRRLSSFSDLPNQCAKVQAFASADMCSYKHVFFLGRKAARTHTTSMSMLMVGCCYYINTYVYLIVHMLLYLYMYMCMYHYMYMYMYTHMPISM